MEIDHKQAQENSFFLFKIILGLIIVGYIFWYFSGGPERWNERFRQINAENKEEHIFTKGVIKIEE